MKKLLLKSLILTLILIFSCKSIAQEDSTEAIEIASDEKIIDSRAKILFGWFLPKVTTSAQLNSSTGKIGAAINLERIFNLPENRKLFRLQGMWRFNNTSSLDAYYYSLNRSGYSISKDSLVFGSIVINIGAEIQSHFNLSLFGGRYNFSIVNDDNFESGFSAGISFLDIDLGTKIKINKSTVGESFNEILFLPVIGFYNRVNFWNDFVFRNHIHLFALDIKRYNGTLFDFAISLEYSFLDHFAVGLAYDVFSLDVQFETGSSGMIQYAQRGAIFFASVKF